MATMTFFDRVRGVLQAFRKAERGNVIITFALATIPMVGFVGTAVDYSRANSAKAAMQAAVDSTALMLSKDAQSLTSAQLSQKAAAYFGALFNRTDVTNIVITPIFTNPQQGNFKLDVAGVGKVPTTFTKVFGQQNLAINVNSEVLWGIKKLELALALDNTGSMSSNNKMTELKKAAKALLTTLKTAAGKDGDVKVAIIPFDTTVNIGTGYKDQPWFDIDSIDCNGWKKGTGCNNNNWKSYWEGCVRDRKYPYDVEDTVPGSKQGTLFPVYDCGSLATILPLTSDWTKLKNKIDEMEPNGMTNVTIGMAWAWHALTPNAPLSEAAAPNNDLDKVIILLTDGENTEAWNNASNKPVTVTSQMDERTRKVCENVKGANIKVYAVRVIDGNAELLKKCASNQTMYFDVSSASQLNAVFGAIAQNLSNLRIAK